MPAQTLSPMVDDPGKLTNAQLSMMLNGADLLMRKSLGQVTFQRVGYLRISRDRGKERNKAGAGLGVQRQHFDICEKCTEAPIEFWYVDNDISAFSGKPRPDYLSMLADIESGVVAARATIWCWHTDRLHRNNTELDFFARLIYDPKNHKRDIQVHSVMSGTLDLRTAAGRLMARQLGAVAAYHSEHMSEQIIAKFDDKARRGDPIAGKRMFGFEIGGRVLVKDEAEAILAAARMILARKSLASATKMVNDRGLTTPWKHNKFTPSDLKRILLRPNIAGLGERPKGTFYVGTWEAIVNREDWNGMRAILTDPSRLSPGAGTRTVSCLGTKNYLCGVCGETMFSKSGQYKCRTSLPGRDKGGVVHVARNVVQLDALVEELILVKLESANIGDQLVRESVEPDVDIKELRERRTELENQITAYRGLVGKPGWGVVEISDAVSTLTTEMNVIDQRLVATVDTSLASQIAAADSVRQAWGEATIEDRRDVLNQLVSITVHRLPRGTLHTKSPCLDIDWHI